MSENPWENLPAEPPFVLRWDRDSIDAHNLANESKCQFKLDAVPVPFMGSIDSPVVLLNLNPGFDPADLVEQNMPNFRQRYRANLRHEAQEYPFFLLDPALRAHPGYGYWKSASARY